MQTMTDLDRKVLTSVGVKAKFGCDILDDDGNVIDDLTPDLKDCTVYHWNLHDVHGAVQLDSMRELDWPNVWLRPWQAVSDGSNVSRFDLGTYRPAIPETPFDGTFHVTGADKLSLLDRSIGDTVVSVMGSSVLAEMQRAIATSAVPGQVIVDSTDTGVLLDADMVWALDVTAPDTFLRWVNDLGGATAYRGIFMDPDGKFQIVKYQAPALRAPEWTFDLTSPTTNITLIDRTMQTDGWTPTNKWTFVRSNMPTEPVEGDGLYIVDRSTGPIKFERFDALDVATQDALVEQGDQIVDTDSHVSQTIKITTGPLPSLWHADVVGYKDKTFTAGIKTTVRDWQMNLKVKTVDITLEVPRG